MPSQKLFHGVWTKCVDRILNLTLTHCGQVDKAPAGALTMCLCLCDWVTEANRLNVHWLHASVICTDDDDDDDGDQKPKQKKH